MQISSRINNWLSNSVSTALLLVMLAAPRLIYAQQNNYQRGNMYYDNDGIFNIDRYYTFGLKVSLMTGQPNSASKESLPEISSKNDIAHYRVLSIGQQTFSPANTYVEQIQKDDRPFAGWLWGGVSWFTVEEKHVDIYELQIGLVGPRAGGEKIMSWFHRLMGYHKPRGWQNQLGDELGVNLALARRWKVEFTADNLPGEGDWIPSVGIVVGNVHTYLGAGSIFRYGWNIPKDFGHALILPGEETGIPSGAGKMTSPAGKWRLYFFALGHGRYVIRNIFLDGNTAHNSHWVEKKLFVADIGGGGAVGYKNVGITLSMQMRSREFVNQPQPHPYASFILTWLF